MFVAGSELSEDEEGLLEMVAEDLLVLHHALGSRALRPIDESLVELHSGSFEQRVVRRVLDQTVNEGVTLLPREFRLVRADELFPNETSEARLDQYLAVLGYQLLHRTPEEDQADDGTALDHRPLARTQPIEPGREQGADAGG